MTGQGGAPRPMDQEAARPGKGGRRLWAIADLHLAATANLAALEALPDFPGDWLIVAGDVGERVDQLDRAFALLMRRFDRVLWTPGNHELWTNDDLPARGAERYAALVALARRHGVVTPEDPYPVWHGRDGPLALCPLFLLYDYGFRPPQVPREGVLDWVRAAHGVMADERRLDPAPFTTRDAWCHDRVARTRVRLEALPDGLPTVLVNHFPLTADTVFAPRLPRIGPWCGTPLTADWHRRFRARIVVYGHLHLRRTVWRDGTRFEEVSLGYPAQWDQRRGIEAYLRLIAG